MKNRQGIGSGHLWAIGYDDMQRAEQVRDEITRIGWDEHYLLLSDVAVVVRHPDGSLTVDREPFPAVGNILGCSAVGFLAGLVVAAPLAGAPSARCWAVQAAPLRRGSGSATTSSATWRR